VPGGTEENREQPQSGYLISGAGFEPGTSRIQSSSVNHLTTAFGGFNRLLHPRYVAVSEVNVLCERSLLNICICLVLKLCNDDVPNTVCEK
jgi:hypothetical protein